MLGSPLVQDPLVPALVPSSHGVRGYYRDTCYITVGLVVTDDDGSVGVAVAGPGPGRPVVAGGAPAQLEAVPVRCLPPPDPAVPVLAPDAHLGNAQWGNAFTKRVQ